MFLLLGHADDPCCTGLADRLRRRGFDARIGQTSFTPPGRVVWRLDAAGRSSSRYADLSDDAIAGVLVRDAGWLDPDGWDADDHAYMQAELRAATLAWLASLPCPVINRPDATLWYRAGAPLLAWRPALQRAGLSLPDILITSDGTDAEAFRRQLAAEGIAGAVYTPLTNAGGYLLADDDAWTRLVAIQKRTPVCLAEPHGAASFACLVGNAILWDRPPSIAAAALEEPMRRFAGDVGLTFVEIAIAPVRRGLAVVLVEPRPRLEHFDKAVRDEILDALVSSLTLPRAAMSVTAGAAS